MWLCALDMHPRATQMVLVTLCRRGIPQCAEGTGWRHCMDPDRVLRRLEVWEARYQQKVDAFVLTSRTPMSCADALQGRGYRVEWVLQEELDDVTRAWRSLGLQARWRRGEWLCGLAMDRLNASPTFFTWTGWDWIFASLSRRVDGLRKHLQSEGLANPAVSGSLAQIG